MESVSRAIALRMLLPCCLHLETFNKFGARTLVFSFYLWSHPANYVAASEMDPEFLFLLS